MIIMDVKVLLIKINLTIIIRQKVCWSAVT